MKQVLLMLELMAGHFFHIIFVNDKGCMHKKNYTFEGKDYSNFPRGWADMIIDFLFVATVKLYLVTAYKNRSCVET